MKVLTFQGFLREYVKELLFSKSINLSKLANELPTNQRLREPAFLNSILSDKQSKHA